jgi:hypothetical protein
MKQWFRQTRDRELWLVRDNMGQLPVFVIPGQTTKDDREAWLITVACALEPDQLRWLYHQLEAITHFQMEGGWLARPARAALVLTKAPGVTPARYIIWGNRRQDNGNGGIHTPPAPEPLSAAADDFVTYVANNAGISNVNEARVIWHQFCRCAVNWMVLERKPLDLLFAEVHAFPYRTNWLQVLTAKFPMFGAIGKLSNEEMQKELKATTFHYQLELPEMASMHQSGTFDWSLTITPKEKFHQHLRPYERQQLDCLNQHGYYVRWLRIVRASYASILAVFRAFFLQSAWPLAAVDFTLPEKSRFLKWHLRKGLVRPLPAELPPVDYCTHSDPPDHDRNTTSSVRDPTTFGVQEVPDEDICLDLRDAGGMG